MAEKYHQPRLPRDCGLDDAYRALLGACAYQILQNWKVVLDTPEIDGPHQLRIGLRRSRAALSAFRGVSRGKRLGNLQTEARAIAAIAGRLRDLDVLGTQIVASVGEAMPEDTDLPKLQAGLTKLQKRVRADVVSELAGDRVAVFVSQLDEAIETPKWRRKHAKGRTKAACIASEALEESWLRVEKWGRNIAELSIPDRHAMRKALKQLRYQTEAFGPLFPSRKNKQFVKKLQHMQDIFGYLNDVALAEKLPQLALATGRDRAAIERATATVLDWHMARYDHAWRKAQRSWKSLRKTEKFWREI